MHIIEEYFCCLFRELVIDLLRILDVTKTVSPVTPIVSIIELGNEMNVFGFPLGALCANALQRPTSQQLREDARGGGTTRGSIDRVSARARIHHPRSPTIPLLFLFSPLPLFSSLGASSP